MIAQKRNQSYRCMFHDAIYIYICDVSVAMFHSLRISASSHGSNEQEAFDRAKQIAEKTAGRGGGPLLPRSPSRGDGAQKRQSPEPVREGKERRKEGRKEDRQNER